jgi:hypothetical protein
MPINANQRLPLQLTVRLINFFGLIFYLLSLCFILIPWGFPKELHAGLILTLTPVPYFLTSIATSFARWQSKGLLLTGILLHAVALVEQCYWPIVLVVSYGLAWFTMYSRLGSKA